MKTLEIHELTDHINEILHLLRDKGESIEVRDQGEIVGRIVPVSKSQENNKREIETFLADMKEITEKVSAHISEKVDAVQIVREGRRQL